MLLSFAELQEMVKIWRDTNMINSVDHEYITYGQVSIESYMYSHLYANATDLATIFTFYYV